MTTTSKLSDSIRVVRSSFEAANKAMDDVSKALIDFTISVNPDLRSLNAREW